MATEGYQSSGVLQATLEEGYFKAGRPVGKECAKSSVFLYFTS